MTKNTRSKSLARDLALKNLDLVHRSSVAYQLARYALGVKYESLPPEVVHQTKRILLDTFACAIGATEAPGRPVMESAIKELGGPAESTVFGSGLQTTAMNATLVNSFMIRYLDYNDLGGGGHNSESIAAILAVAEREKAGARDFITSMVLSYEMGARVREAMPAEEFARELVAGGEFERRGWTIDCRAGLYMPAALGKLMGLNEDQIANAIGIAGAHTPSLGILDAHREENTMAKNMRFGFAAHHSILSCLLAKKGFTGFVRVIEGDRGFNELLANGQMDLQRLVDFSGWRILRGGFKTICQNWSTQAHILATLAIVKEHDLKPEDIASVKIKTSPRDARHVTTISGRKYPRNTESATHSAFFGNAMVIKERALGPEQYRPDKFDDPTVIDLIEKITVAADPSLPEFGPGGGSEITTIDGRRFEKRFDVPHGHPSDPVTDAEIEEKFRRAANLYMEPGKVQSMVDTVWNLEKLTNIKDLAKLMVWE